MSLGAVTTLIGGRGPYRVAIQHGCLERDSLVYKGFCVVFYIYCKTVLGLILSEKVEVVFKA